MKSSKDSSWGPLENSHHPLDPLDAPSTPLGPHVIIIDVILHFLLYIFQFWLENGFVLDEIDLNFSHYVLLSCWKPNPGICLMGMSGTFN